jgi:CRISPR/Cas system-associated protein Cas10 (large subunit of type III CRISPR-Cas system)
VYHTLVVRHTTAVISFLLSTLERKGLCVGLKMGKAIIILPPPESGTDDGDRKQTCTSCHRLKASNFFDRDSEECNACSLVRDRTKSSSHFVAKQLVGSESIRGKAGYSKQGKHQVNYSATKRIKP